jgi:hypothetical protein
MTSDELREFFQQFQDYLAPKLDTYEQAIYLYVFRHGRGCPAFLLKMAKRSLPLVRLRGFHFVRKNSIV